MDVVDHVPRVSGALGKAVDILGDCFEAWVGLGERSKGVVGGVWGCAEGHVAPKTVELGDETGLFGEGFGSGEERGVVSAPKTAGTTEGGEAGGGGEA